MRAAVYQEFGGAIEIREVAEPVPAPGEVTVRVAATGVCRSDFHGWQGHDADITTLPHVPGHELAGEIAAIGDGVTGWQVGDRVAVPFIAGCGRCQLCEQGDSQVCPNQSQPGFTHWGSFAEVVTIRNATFNLVALPESISFVTAAPLGCRFTTAYRAVVAQGRAQPGDWLAVHGCGGVGLSAVMIGAALGAAVIAIDPSPAARQLAAEVGAAETMPPGDDLVQAIFELTGGGPAISVDAIGSGAVAAESIASLRRRGRHVQVGLITTNSGLATIPLSRVISHELEILGSHGIQAGEFPAIFELIDTEQIDPSRLIQRTVGLEQGIAELTAMGETSLPGITVIDHI